MIIKKLLCVLVLLSILICTAPPACAETEDVPVGFGFVNAKDVALRREACDWVKDAKGVRWLNLNAGLNQASKTVPLSMLSRGHKLGTKKSERW